MGTPTQAGACGQLIFSTTPASAPTQTIVSTKRAVPGSIVSAATGVYVPAMNRKIIEWSSRFMIARLRGSRHVRRW